MKNIFLLLIVLLTVSSCSTKTKIDATSEEKLQKSIAKIMSELKPDQQKEFVQSLKIIMFDEVKDIIDLSSMTQNSAISKGVFQSKIDGKTAQEIIKIAKGISLNLENEKPISEKSGIPVSADDYIKNYTPYSSEEQSSGQPISADDFLNEK